MFIAAPATSVLLINPPLWSLYAPHLAVPLLQAVLRRHSIPTRALDLSALTLRWLLSEEEALAYLAERPGSQPGAPVEDRFEAALAGIQRATAFLRSADSVGDAEGYRAALSVCSQVLDGLAARTPGGDLHPRPF